MSFAVLISIGISMVAASICVRMVDMGYWRQAFFSRLRIEAMDRHNELLSELLADPSISDETKESVCMIGGECFEKTTALRLIDRILALPSEPVLAYRNAESVIVAEAVSSALDVAITFSAERIRIPEKKRLTLIRNPGLACVPAL